MADKVSLTIGISNTPLTKALLQGQVSAEGIDLTLVGAYGAGPASGQILAGKIDGGEFSLSSLLMASARGVRLVVLPIFLGRGFVQRGLWRRADSGIRTPAEYAGKRVAVHRYNNSYGVWARALLATEYGVDLRSIHWVTAREELEGEPWPAGTLIERVPGPVERLPQLLEEGAVDGALELYLFEASPVAQRVFEDYRVEEAAYFARTQVFPMYHTIVLRPEAVNGQDWILQSLLGAFRESRRQASTFMSDEERAETTWLESVLEEDPYAFRFGPSERRSFEQLNQSMVREGLLDRLVDVDSFFAIDG